MPLEKRDVAILTSIGTWRKGNATLIVAIQEGRIHMTPCIGSGFYLSLDAWLDRKVRLEDEGWVLDLDEGFTSENEITSVKVRNSDLPTLRVRVDPDSGIPISGIEIPKAPKAASGLEAVIPNTTPTIPAPSSTPDDPYSWIVIQSETILRREGDKLFLIPNQEDGISLLVESEDWVAQRFNVRFGEWSRDSLGEYCSVIKVSHRVVLKPPRPRE